MHITLSYFGPARSVSGTAGESVDLPEASTIGALQERLIERFGDRARAWAFALNDTWSGLDTPLSDGDEVAVLPPVSGGSEKVALTREPVNIATLVGQVSSPAAGAIDLFLGTVRNEFEGEPAIALFYEAEEALALKELAKLAEACRSAYPICDIAMVHRLGRLSLEEVSVAVAVSAPHRATAFEACRFAIDRLKTSVPIYKQEIGPGQERWHEGTPTPHHPA